jgi:hypothetical protein
MRSPGEAAAGPRLWLERLARGLAILLLLWLLADLFRGRAEPLRASVRAPDLTAQLSRWSTAADPASVHVESEGFIAPFQRDWLAALSGAGTLVTWGPEAGAPLALAVEPVADPEGGVRAWIAAPSGARVLVEDRAGPLDSLSAAGGGARLLVRSNPAELRARAGGSVAGSAATDSLVLGRLLLLGRAGWESKFVAAALEERGWKLDARLRLSPRGDVRQGAVTPLDTVRYSAVLVLDSIGNTEARAVARFVREGGGAVIAASAAGASTLAALSAGSPGPSLPGREPFDSTLAEPRRSLELVSLAPRQDAVVLEYRGNAAAVAARRVERGRVVTIGYRDTWRWRMGGGEASVQAHRDWWADLVAGVAYAGRVTLRPGPLTDEAPLATLIDRLGPATGAPAGPGPGLGISRAWLFGWLAAALLLEWASRRLRGAP